MKIERRDWLIAAALFVVGLAIYTPFRSRYVYHWDGGEFVMAVKQYSVALSQPHVPGYFLYVALGKLVNLCVGDAHAALVWLSVFCGAALAGTVSLLGTSMFDRRAGIAAGLVALTSPQVWFHSEVALMYVVDAFFVCVLVLYGWRAMQRGGTWGDAVVIGILVAVVGGVRQQTVPPLCVLLAFFFWRFRERWLAKLMVAALVGLVGGCCWLVPMVQSAGGWVAYMENLERHVPNDVSASLAGGGVEALLNNVVAVGAYCWNGLLAASVLVAWALIRRQGGEGKRALALWIVPMLLMGTVIGHTSQPGYVLSYLPAMFLLAGVAARRWWWLAAVVAVNIFGFLAWPPAWDGALFGVGRTACEIRQHDAQLERTIRVLRQKFNPDDTVLIHAGEWYLFGLRHFQVHAPEFEQYQLVEDPTVPTPPGRATWHVKDGQLDFVSGLNVRGKQHVVLVVPPYLDRSIFGKRLPWMESKPVEEADDTLYVLTGDPTAAVTTKTGF